MEIFDKRIGRLVELVKPVKSTLNVLHLSKGIRYGLMFFNILLCCLSAWNKYFTSAGHRVRQSAVCAGHSQLVPVFCLWYTFEIWKPAGHSDQQKTNPVGHTWNRAGQWPMTGGDFMHWVLIREFYIIILYNSWTMSDKASGFYINFTYFFFEFLSNIFKLNHFERKKLYFV